MSNRPSTHSYEVFGEHKTLKQDYEDAQQQTLNTAADLWDARDDTRLINGTILGASPEVIAAQQTHNVAIANEAAALVLAHEHATANLGDLREIAQLEAQAEGVHIDIAYDEDAGVPIPIGHDR